jgi:hypothetical protein
MSGLQGYTCIISYYYFILRLNVIIQSLLCALLPVVVDGITVVRRTHNIAVTSAH